MMVVPPGQPCQSFSETFRTVFEQKAVGETLMKRVMRGHRGLSARSVEFFINYSITGATSVYVVWAFDKWIRGETKDASN